MHLRQQCLRMAFTPAPPSGHVTSMRFFHLHLTMCSVQCLQIAVSIPLIRWLHSLDATHARTHSIAACRMQGRPHGDFDERPQRTSVAVDAFHIGVTEVTNAEYERFDPSHAMLRGFEHGYSTGDDEAVVFVSHANATAYCAWLTAQHQAALDEHNASSRGAAASSSASDYSDSRSSALTAYGPLTYRLPTEIEWERAARAGTATNFWWGNDFDTHHARAPGSTCPTACPNLTVAKFAANPFGIYDTAGNVEEWTSSP